MGQYDRGWGVSTGFEAMTTFDIRPRRPYALGLTVERFTRFPEVVDRVEDASYRRLLDGEVGGPLLLDVSQRGAPSRAVLRVRLVGPRARTARARRVAIRIVERALGAATGVRSFYDDLGDDPILGRPIRRFRGLRAAGWPSLWEALVTAILCQQVNLRFAYSIRRELALAFGRRARLDGGSWVAFPTPARVARGSAEALERFRLSRSKARAIHELAVAFASGSLAEDELDGLSDEAAIARLTAHHGVGRWTAEVALLRGLARRDAFPAADLGVVKYLARDLLGRSRPASEGEMRRFAERWRPHRGLALIYAYAEMAAARPPGSARRFDSPRRAG
jgi:DNA-3-methyladenine glycosylase II